MSPLIKSHKSHPRDRRGESWPVFFFFFFFFFCVSFLAVLFSCFFEAVVFRKGVPPLEQHVGGGLAALVWLTAAECGVCVLVVMPRKAKLSWGESGRTGNNSKNNSSSSSSRGDKKSGGTIVNALVKFGKAAAAAHRAIPSTNERHRETVGEAKSHVQSCKRLSNGGKHFLALRSAWSAVSMMKECVVAADPLSRTGRSHQHLSSNGDGTRLRNDTVDSVVDPAIDEVQVLLTAFTHMGVEAELIRNWELALAAYTNARSLQRAFFQRAQSDYMPQLKQSVVLTEKPRFPGVRNISDRFAPEDGRIDKSTSAGQHKRRSSSNKQNGESGSLPFFPTAVEGHATPVPRRFSPHDAEVFRTYCGEVIHMPSTSDASGQGNDRKSHGIVTFKKRFTLQAAIGALKRKLQRPMVPETQARKLSTSRSQSVPLSNQSPGRDDTHNSTDNGARSVKARGSADTGNAKRSQRKPGRRHRVRQRKVGLEFCGTLWTWFRWFSSSFAH